MKIPHTQKDINTQNAYQQLAAGCWYVFRASLVMLLALGLNMTGFGFATETALAYYGDYEISNENSFTAAMLDFSISKNERESYVGLEADGDIDDFSSIVQPHPDSLDTQYRVDAQMASSSNTGFCEAIEFTISHLGTGFEAENESGNSILDVSRPTTTTMGTWEFEDIDLTNEASAYPHGAECNVDLVFSGWRQDANTPAESGYTDEQRIKLRLKNRMVVMNEFLPNPDPSEHGLDFGDDHDNRPNGEWVELYNNSDVPQDLSGWHFVDEGNAHTVSVSAGNTKPATTTIPANDWLVVYMNKAVLNNTGDTITLKDDAGRVVDEYTYESDGYCEKQPSPTATNTASSVGDCDVAPPNKSYARIHDGIGGWVDPIPTPGTENTKQQPQAQTSSQEVAGTSTATTTADVSKATTTPAQASASSTQATSSESDPTDAGGASDENTSSSTSSDDQMTPPASTSTNTVSSSSEATSTPQASSTLSATSSEAETTSTSTASSSPEMASTSKAEQITASSSKSSADTASTTASSTQATSTESKIATSSTQQDTASTTQPIESKEKATSSQATTSDEGAESDQDDDVSNQDSEIDTQQKNTESMDPIEKQEKKNKQSDQEAADDKQDQQGGDDDDQDEAVSADEDESTDEMKEEKAQEAAGEDSESDPSSVEGEDNNQQHE